MRSLATLSLLVLAAAPVFWCNTAPTPPVVSHFLDLFDRLRSVQEKAARGEHQSLSFVLSENDVNEYLRYSLRNTPRPGLDSITVKFSANDYVSTVTRVDFDAVEDWRAGTIPAALRPFLKGKKTIAIDFRIHADRSMMTFNVEKARYEDTALPSILVNKIIQIVAAQQPEKYDTSKPMPVPFGLKKISTAEHLIQGNN